MMIIKSIEIQKFRAFQNVSFTLGKRLTAISGRNATQKTTVLGMIGQPFTISKSNPMSGCRTIDGYNFRSQFKEKFKISPTHDVIGEHRWTLHLHNDIYEEESFTVESIARKQRNKKTTLRFWNAKSRVRGAGYIQIPVYFLSLSRLFPIGESGKIKKSAFDLTQEECKYCIRNYQEILSIHGKLSEASIDIEQGSSTRTFAGVNDNIHDIFTSSAGEGNVMRIILAVLSFKRLEVQYPKYYKGGILLIDELDATLYGFSQKKLVDYLWKAAKSFRIQIVFTTHSPIILREVNKYQRYERQHMTKTVPDFAYNSSIVYLEPKYDEKNARTIQPRNISTSTELREVLGDLNLVLPDSASKISIYCEDEHAASFVRFIIQKKLNINLDLYMKFIDINLGWPNYIQLYEKKVPEFINNIILLDADVPNMKEFKKKREVVSKSQNILFLPIEVEKDLFSLLKRHEKFCKFESEYSNVPNLNYDICFNDWPLDVEQYDSNEFKHWFAQIEKYLGSREPLFNLWCDLNENIVDAFVNKFVESFNILAEKSEMDLLPESND